MDCFLTELIGKMGECLLAMQAPCGDQTRAIFCSSDAKRMLCSNAGVAKGVAEHSLIVRLQLNECVRRTLFLFIMFLC